MQSYEPCFFDEGAHFVRAGDAVGLLVRLLLLEGVVVLIRTRAWFLLKLAFFHDAFGECHAWALGELALHLEVQLPVSYRVVLRPRHELPALRVAVNEVGDGVLGELSGPGPVGGYVSVGQLVARDPKHLVALALPEVRLNDVLD